MRRRLEAVHRAIRALHLVHAPLAIVRFGAAVAQAQCVYHRLLNGHRAVKLDLGNVVHTVVAGEGALDRLQHRPASDCPAAMSLRYNYIYGVLY